MPDARSGSRDTWLWELGKTGNGWTGVAIWLGIAAISGWWLVRAGGRVATAAPALVWDGRELSFHSSFGAGLVVPIDRVEGVDLRQEVPPRLFGLTPSIDTLFFAFGEGQGRFHNRRKVKVRSNTIEGGREALARFLAALGPALSDRCRVPEVGTNGDDQR